MPVTIDDIYLRDRGLCGLCGEPVKLKQASIDHIIPRSKDGKDCLHNTQLAHLQCNLRKRASMPDVLPLPCDCPASDWEDEPEPKPRPPRRQRDEGPSKPDYMTFPVVAGLDKKGLPCALIMPTWPNGDRWLFEIDFTDIDLLVGQLQSVRAILTLHNFNAWLQKRETER